MSYDIKVLRKTEILGHELVYRSDVEKCKSEVFNAKYSKWDASEFIPGGGAVGAGACQMFEK